jgi:ABC-type nitrate/sulfonate/bicarbonate transport system permease component
MQEELVAIWQKHRCTIVFVTHSVDEALVLPPALLPAPSAVLHALGDWVFGFDETTQTYSGHWARDAFASALRVFGGFAPSPQPDRPSGRPGDRGGLSGDHQAR